MNTKKNIVIVTFFGSENYGSNIQALGLASILKQWGYDVKFLSTFRNHAFLLLHPAMLYTRLLNRLNRKKYEAFFLPNPYTLSEERTNKLERFNNRHYKTVTFQDWKEWKEAIDKDTIFIAGSDIIWNPAKGYPTTMFLDFAYYAKLPRFSYASSIGDAELPHKYYPYYRKYLGSMMEVGVREQSVVSLLEPIIGRTVTKVADPSMILTHEQWDEYADNAEVSVPISDKGFIVCYFVMKDDRYWEYVKKIKGKTDLQIIVLPMHNEDESRGYDTIMDGTLNEFIWLIKNAAFVCTDSFHACTISLIYEKEFYLLRRVRKAEDAKFDDFLNHFHLQDRVVTDESAFVRKPDTDYQYARTKLEKDRKDSLDYLERTLKNARSDKEYKREALYI